jgi:hypothetical protein
VPPLPRHHRHVHIDDVRIRRLADPDPGLFGPLVGQLVDGHRGGPAACRREQSVDNSRWNIFGNATSGPLENSALEQIPHVDRVWSPSALRVHDGRLRLWYATHMAGNVADQVQHIGGLMPSLAWCP